jgi:ferredoxin
MKYIGPIEDHIHYLVEKCGDENVSFILTVNFYNFFNPAHQIKIDNYNYKLPFFEECYPTKMVDPIECEHCKLVSYCSESCKERAWYEFHEVIKTVPND